MKLSTREILLAWITLMAILIGSTIWLGQPAFKKWQDSHQEMATIQQEMEIVQRKLTNRNDWEVKLATFREQLPEHPAEKDVTAELLKLLEQTASKHSLNLLRREPEKEKQVDGLYEAAIHCTWEGELEALVRFLYEVQIKGILLDVRQLTATPAKSGSGKLKGSFIVDFAYSRTEKTE